MMNREIGNSVDVLDKGDSHPGQDGAGWHTIQNGMRFKT
jgi:hypothetical protein